MSFQSVSDSVYASKYQLFDKHGNALDKDREDSFLRVAKALAKNEKDFQYWTEQFFIAMTNGAVPAGRIFGNAGAEEHKPNTSLINCIVSDTIEDSIESIGKAVEESLITLSGGSGIGYEFSSLRPKGSYVAGVGACFTEDTEILDVNLNSISFKDLEQKLISEDVYTFSTSPNGSLQVSKILKCWVTKQAKTYVKVTLDNGSIIKCTTDHKFLLRSGEYISAINLTPNMSLMPLYHKTTAKHNDKNLRNYVLDNLSGKYIPVYKLSSHRKECKALQVPDDVKVCVHHKDFNSLNDEPTNLEFLTESDHFRLHTLVRNADPDFQAILAKTAKERANKLWEKLRNDQDAFAEWQRKQLAHRDDPLWKQRQSSIAQRSICSEAVIEKRVQNHKKYVQQNRESFNVEQNRRALKGQETRINSIIAELKQRNMALTSANFDHIGLSKSNGCGASFKKAMKVRPDLLIDFIDNKINPYNRSEKRCETCINKVLTELKSRKLEKTISAFTEVMDELYEPAYLNWPLIKHHFPEFPTLLTEYNHTVQKVEFCTSEKLLNFYDLEVDVSFHNFPLACGVFVHNSTSGPLPFADIFDKGCFTIASAGGRRGAQMATFDLRHPDVLDFIKAKREDGRFRQFNISVLVSDSFFDESDEWLFRFPIRKSDPTLLTAETVWDNWHIKDDAYPTNEKGQTLFKVYGRMQKSELWELILKSNYDYAEPGIIFIDRLNHENNLWFCEDIRAMNPCVIAGTQILTRSGYRNIETLVGQGVDIWNGYEWSMVVPKITGENQKVMNVQFSNGSSLTCTWYHRFKLQDNITIEAQDLKLDDKVATYYTVEGFKCENIKVVKLEDAGIAELVYCFNEPKRHTAVFNGIVTSQCGEQPLPPNGACLLGSIDLTKFVEDPFTDEADFDFDKFADTVDVFTRMLDNVVEFNNLPLEGQREEILRKRRHGMGFFGLGSALILLGIRYDSDEALEFAEKVTKLMAIRGYETGCQLAKEKGSAPILDEYFELTPEIIKKCPSLGDLHLGQRIRGNDLFLQSPYMQRLLEDESKLKQDLLLHGCRFTHHTSIAPTGTISLALGDNTSGGVEPSFSHQYFRNVTTEGKKTRQQQVVYSKEFLLYKELYGKNKTDEQLLKELPDYFVTADTISWEAHVKMVAAVQKWVDSSISKCVEGSTLVPTNYGLKRMDELSKVLHTTHDSFEEPLTDLKVLCPDGKMRNVTNHYFGGKKQCKKIRFNNGYELTASLTHRVKTPFGWRTFGELSVGDSVLCSSAVAEYEGVAGQALPEAAYKAHYSKPILIPTQVTTDFSLFVGMWLADGSLTESNGAINFSNSDDFVIDQYIELIVELFSINPRVVYDPRSSKKLRTVTFASKRCCQWLKNLCGNKAGSKKIPDQIMSGSRNELLALLKGLSLDGCNLDNATCIYEGKSHLLAKQLFEICFVLGLEPRFGKKWVATHNYYVYGVRVYGFNGCLESRKDSGGKHDRLVPVPEEVYTLDFDRSHPQRVILGVIQRGERHSGSIKETTLIKLGIDYDSTIYTVLITDIEDVVTKVYDITVEESHDYSLGGIWSHNTINVPTEIPFKEFEGVYNYAYQAGCKAISTFRYNPETLGAILSRSEDLEKSRYEFKLADGTVIQCAGGDRVEYDGEVTTAENLFSALKENTYGKF